MPGSACLAIDGLWMRLCPSLDRYLLWKAPSFVKTGRRPARQPRPPYGNVFKLSTGRWQFTDSTVDTGVEGKVRRISSGLINWASTLPTEELKAQIPKLALKPARDLTVYLLQKRGVLPSVELFKALILANCGAQYGSVGAVELLLEEMERENVPIDGGILHAALKALAVHPDHLLRTSILEAMKDKWIELSVDGWHDVVVGLLRERLIEMALVKVTEMRQQSITVHPWLQSLLIYTCCDIGEFSAARKEAQNVLNLGEDVTPNVWYYMLDSASRAFDRETTSFVWTKVVEPMYLNPGSGICNNILATAARVGDNNLVSEVLRVLSNRRQRLTLVEYETLIDSLVASDHIEGAFHILSTMKNAGMPPTSGSTRSILAYMLNVGSEYPTQAWDLLKKLQSEPKSPEASIPIAAVNVILEAQILIGEDPDLAYEWYKEIPTFDSLRPNTATYNILIPMDTAEAFRIGRAFTLFQEMQSLGILPDNTTWESMILAYLKAGQFKEAHDQFLLSQRKLQHSVWVTSRRFHSLAIEFCHGVKDEFAEKLLGLVESRASPLRGTIEEVMRMLAETPQRKERVVPTASETDHEAEQAIIEAAVNMETRVLAQEPLRLEDDIDMFKEFPVAADPVGVAEQSVERDVIVVEEDSKLTLEAKLQALKEKLPAQAAWKAPKKKSKRQPKADLGKAAADPAMDAKLRHLTQRL